MASVLDGLRAVLTRKQSTAEALERDLADAAEKYRRAVERVASLQAMQHAPETLAAEGGTTRLRLTLQGAKDEAEDLGAYVAAIGERHAQAVAAEAETGRRERYAQAERARDAAVKVFREQYPAAAKAFAQLARAVWEADALVVEANADAPAGAPVLELVEAVRDRLPEPRKELAHEDEIVWRTDDRDCYNVSPSAERQEREDGTYARRGSNGWWKVRKRTVRTHRWIAAHPGEPGARLYDLTLPGLRRGDPNIMTGFRASDIFGMPVTPHPRALLDGLDALAKARPAPLPERVTETRRELLPLDEPPEPRRATPWPDDEKGEPYIAAAPRTRIRRTAP